MKADHYLTVALVLVATGCASTTPIVAAGEQNEATAFTHVNVVPMNGEEVHLDQTVIVSGDRIVQWGPAASLALPDGATVIDGKGKYLLPGLSDMHAHIAPNENDLALFIANGVTFVRNMSGEPLHLNFQRRIASGDLLGPTIHTTGPIIDGESPLFPGSAIVASAEDAERQVDAQRNAGYAAIKVYAGLQPKAYEAILLAANNRGLPVYGHVPWRVGLRNALRQGQRSFEHLIDFLYELIPDDSPARAKVIAANDRRDANAMHVGLWAAVTTEGMDELAAEAAAAGAWFCPTLVVMDRIASNDAEFNTHSEDPAVALIHPMLRQSWEARIASFSPEAVEARRRGLPTVGQAVSALHRAGVHILVGTDTPNPYVLPGFSVHDELRLLVEAGLSPYEALKAATADAAAFVGLEKEWGTIAAGLRADLLMVDGNPLENIRSTSDISGVMVRGKWYSSADLRARLRSISEEYRDLNSQAP
ncbi:MAG: amidohydrolase family protein [Fimbriimonadaceae bacterium]|nr:MAG: amidohydrolase family protein [Fimbriimonadaceae bacterium]